MKRPLIRFGGRFSLDLVLASPCWAQHFLAPSRSVANSESGNNCSYLKARNFPLTNRGNLSILPSVVSKGVEVLDRKVKENSPCVFSFSTIIY